MQKRNIMNKSNFILSLYNKIENYKSNKFEILCFVLYILLTAFMACFHEPWYDEFQAWGISKDSLYNILFYIPHFEGHPPLWHLVLKCFTSFDIPAEASIKIPNLLFMYAAVWLLIFKSPFPRIIRLSLPFTYFLFYQYAIVSRPYSMFVLALFLCAVFYRTKDSNPFRFISILGFLSLTSLYGMVLATGITLAWVWEIWDKKNFFGFIKNFVKDKRFFAMLCLFFFCLILAIMIAPNIGYYVKNPIPFSLRFLYCFLGIFSDATFFTFFDYSFKLMKNIPLLVVGSIFGSLILYVLCKELYKFKFLRYIYVLYFLLLFFFIYIWPHHVGLVFAILITFFWWIVDTNKEKIKHSGVFLFIVAFTIISQISWSICSYVSEYKCNYSPSRELANYIMDNQLDKYNLLSHWSWEEYYIDKKGQVYDTLFEIDDGVEYTTHISENINLQLVPVLVNPYFKKNIFLNNNIDNVGKLYTIRVPISKAKAKQIKKQWFKSYKYDFVVGRTKVTRTPFDEQLRDYYEVRFFEGNFIFKNKMTDNHVFLYVHKDLYRDFFKKISKKENKEFGKI